MSDTMRFVPCGFGLISSHEHQPQQYTSNDFSIQANLMIERNAVIEQLKQVVPAEQSDNFNKFMTQSVSLSTVGLDQSNKHAEFMNYSELFNSCEKQLKYLAMAHHAQEQTALPAETDYRWAQVDTALNVDSIINNRTDFKHPTNDNVYNDPWN